LDGAIVESCPAVAEEVLAVAAHVPAVAEPALRAPDDSLPDAVRDDVQNYLVPARSSAAKMTQADELSPEGRARPLGAPPSCVIKTRQLVMPRAATTQF